MRSMMRRPSVYAGHDHSGAKKRVVPGLLRNVAAVEDKTVRGELKNSRLLNSEHGFFDRIAAGQCRDRPAQSPELCGYRLGEAVIEIGDGLLVPSTGEIGSRVSGCCASQGGGVRWRARGRIRANVDDRGRGRVPPGYDRR